jgi:UDP-N-acetylglucosamine:LPS N-acetylglucosamine transferase
VTEVLGRLRARGRLDVPFASAITDLAALRYWAHPACDLHLITHPESEAEVRALAGDHTRIVPVRGLNPPGFSNPPAREAARRALELPAAGPVILVSGGGWGVGDIEGAVAGALEVPHAQVLVLCGNNDELRERFESRPDPHVRPLGFTDRMPELMAAADVLIHSTAGLTVLEAAICGCWTISYGWGRGHIRANNRAFKRFGLADVAEDRAALRLALARALRADRARDTSWLALPTAGAVVLEFASAR